MWGKNDPIVGSTTPVVSGHVTFGLDDPVVETPSAKIIQIGTPPVELTDDILKDWQDMAIEDLQAEISRPDSVASMMEQKGLDAYEAMPQAEQEHRFKQANRLIDMAKRETEAAATEDRVLKMQELPDGYRPDYLEKLYRGGTLDAGQRALRDQLWIIQHSPRPDDERSLASKQLYTDYVSKQTDKALEIVRYPFEERDIKEREAQVRSVFGGKAWNYWQRGVANIASGGLDFLRQVEAVATLGKYGSSAGEQARMYYDLLNDPKFQPIIDNEIDAFLDPALESAPYMMMSWTPAYLASVFAGGAAAALVGKIAGGFVSYAVEGNSIYQNAMDSGKSETEARLRGMAGGAINAWIEVRGGSGGKYFKDRMEDRAVGRMMKAKRFTKKVLEEGFTEGFKEEFPQEITAIIAGDDIPRLPDGTIDSDALGMRLGAAAGFGMFLGGTMASMAHVAQTIGELNKRGFKAPSEEEESPEVGGNKPRTLSIFEELPKIPESDISGADNGPGTIVEGGTPTPGQQQVDAAQRAVSVPAVPEARPKELTEPFNTLKYPIASLSDTELEKRLKKASPLYKWYKMEQGFRERERAAVKSAAPAWQSGAARPFEFDESSTPKIAKFRLIDPKELSKTWISAKGGALPPSLYGLPETKGVQYIMGRRTKDATPEVQEVRFSQKQFSETDAARWMAENGAALGRPDVAEAAKQRANQPNVTNLEDAEMSRRQALKEAVDEIRNNSMYKLAMEGIAEQAANTTALETRTIFFEKKYEADIESYAGEDRRNKVWRQVTFDKTQGQAWDDAAQEAGIGDDFDTFMAWWVDAIESGGSTTVNNKALDIARERGDPELQLLSTKRSLLEVPQSALAGGKGGPDINAELKRTAAEIGADFGMDEDSINAMYDRVKVKGKYANTITKPDNPAASGPGETPAAGVPSPAAGERTLFEPAQPQPAPAKPAPNEAVKEPEPAEPEKNKVPPEIANQARGQPLPAFGTRNAETERIRDMLGLTGVPTPEKQSMAQWLEEAIAKEMTEQDKVLALARELVGSPRPMSKHEDMAAKWVGAQLVLESERLGKEASVAADEAIRRDLQAQRKQADVKIELLTRADKMAGSEWAYAGVSRSADISDDGNLQSNIRRIEDASGKPTSDKQKEAVRKLTEDVVSLREEITQLKQRQLERAAEDLITEGKQRSQRKPKMSRSEIEQTLTDLIAAGC